MTSTATHAFKYTKAIALAVMAVSSFGSARAQADVQNNGVLYISGSADIVYINAALTNASGAALTNNGKLYVSKTLTNNQVSMPTGAGSLYLNGSSAQTVAGAQPFKTYNLTTDNTGGVVLNNDLDVSGSHTFTNGIISSSATPNYLIYEEGSTYSGDGDSRHVSGWVKKRGSSDFVFPTGNGTVERIIAINSLASVSEFNAHHYLTTPNPNNLLAPLVAADPNEYWQLDRVTGGNARVNLNWNDAKVDFPPYPLGSIRAGYNTGGLWTNAGGSAVGDPATFGNVTSNIMSSFGTFVVASISSALPLNFLSAYAYRKPAGTLVQWQTANEIHVNHFEIERSLDGHSFVRVGTVPSADQHGIGGYSYVDTYNGLDKLYYRIRSVDDDGKFIFSRIMVVIDGTQNRDLFTVANPVVKRINITVSTLAAGRYNYRLLTETGQLAQGGELQIGGSGVYGIDLNASITPGVYILSIGDQRFIKNEKLRIF